MNVENIKVKDLIPYANNAKKHPDNQVEYIANSIKEFGFKIPVIVDKNNVLIAGHGRLMAAKKLKLTEVPCVRADDLTEEQIKAFRLADNKVAESEWDFDILADELDTIFELDMDDFGFGEADDSSLDKLEPDDDEDDRDPSCQHNVFENQELMQFPCVGKYGIPVMEKTDTTGDKMLRFMDWKEVENPEDYIAHFYYDDYKFMAAWRDPNKFLDKLKQFKAIVSPDFSLYTDFPVALQILSCYRRQWCGAYWQHMGLDVIPDVVWGKKESYEFCFDGIPEGGTVAVSTVGVKNDKTWNDEVGSLFRDGYNEMMKRLCPSTILFYGDMIEGLEGNIIRIPSYYEERRKILNARPKKES